MAAGHIVSHQAASSVANAPSGLNANQNQHILLMMVASGAIIFIDHARSGEPQTGNQYAALGVVGFALLFLGEFWPEMAFGISILILLSIILNSPRGLPFVPTKKKTTKNKGTNVSNAANVITKGNS